MALFKMLRGNESYLPKTVVDGQVYFCQDTNNFYIDCGTYRYQIAAKYAEMLRYVVDGSTIEIEPSALLTDANYAIKIGTASANKAGLMSTADKQKLDDIAPGAQVNIIDAVSDEFTIAADGKTLNINAIDQSKITGLVDILRSKVDAVEGSRLMTSDEGNKLAGIANGAEVNLIDIVQINGVALNITDKTVNILTSDIVKGSEEVTVSQDGTLGIGTVSTDKLVQGEFVLILNGNSK